MVRPTVDSYIFIKKFKNKIKKKKKTVDNYNSEINYYQKKKMLELFFFLINKKLERRTIEEIWFVGAQ